MDAKIRDFVEIYKAKPMPEMTIKEFIRSHNHEIWRKCPNCGNYEDLRKTYYCPDCGAQLDPNFNKMKIEHTEIKIRKVGNKIHIAECDVLNSKMKSTITMSGKTAEIAKEKLELFLQNRPYKHLDN